MYCSHIFVHVLVLEKLMPKCLCFGNFCINGKDYLELDIHEKRRMLFCLI